jgi:hypothetical protein
MQKSGFDRVQTMLAKITPAIQGALAQANEKNAQEIVDLAKVLIPNVTGASRAAIGHIANPDGSQLLDFGKKAKVIEGGKAPRPFVNPALAATKNARKARNRKAIRDAARSL